VQFETECSQSTVNQSYPGYVKQRRGPALTFSCPLCEIVPSLIHVVLRHTAAYHRILYNIVMQCYIMIDSVRCGHISYVDVLLAANTVHLFCNISTELVAWLIVKSDNRCFIVNTRIRPAESCIFL